MWSRSWEYVPGIENLSPLLGEKGIRKTLFHGFRVGGLRRAAAPPVATSQRPVGAFKANHSPITALNSAPQRHRIFAIMRRQPCVTCTLRIKYRTKGER